MFYDEETKTKYLTPDDVINFLKKEVKNVHMKIIGRLLYSLVGAFIGLGIYAQIGIYI